jgi:anti-sigma factor RsiW
MKPGTRPSPRCRALLLDISRFLDGDLPPARRRSIARHVRACTCCDQLARQLQWTVAACRAEGTRLPPPAVRKRAADRIRKLIAAARIPQSS